MAWHELERRDIFSNVKHIMQLFGELTLGTQHKFWVYRRKTLIQK